ncbi:MAG: hypothetical protein ACLURV_14780 [Gallintestinimicrobium sp.]
MALFYHNYAILSTVNTMQIEIGGIPMKAAKLTEHPSFRLMRQTDIQNVWHMQMPRWLFSDPRYADMSLDAKVTYTFLLNRFQLCGATAG